VGGSGAFCALFMVYWGHAGADHIGGDIWGHDNCYGFCLFGACPSVPTSG
jgi:hypothetical protein